jgi:cell division protein FtsQ
VATRRTAAPARAAVIPFPGKQARAAAHRLVPTPRSLLVGLAVILAAGGLYVVARETSLFAIREVRVVGAPPGIAREVREAAQIDVGKSLLRLDGAALLKRLRALPDVAAVRYDRGFPHTLRLIVTPERPVAVLRQGSAAWVVSMRGRVVRIVPHHSRQALPRLWVGRSTRVTVGALLHDHLALRAIAALDPLVKLPLPARIANVHVDRGEVTLVTASKVEIHLGPPTDLALKLAVARRILPTVAPATSGVAYVDVSVPEWSVTGVRTLDSQVEVQASTNAKAGIAH